MAKAITDLPVASVLDDADPLVLVDSSLSLTVQANLERIRGNGASVWEYFGDFDPRDAVEAYDDSASTGTGTQTQIAGDQADADEGFGIVALSTGAAAGRADLVLGKSSLQLIRGEKIASIEARVKLPATPTDIGFSFGFDNASSGSDMARMYIDETFGLWRLECQSTNGTGTVIDATAVAAVAGWQTLRIDVVPATSATAFVNGTQVATVTDGTAVLQSNDAATFNIFAERAAGPSRSVSIDWVRIRGTR